MEYTLHQLKVFAKVAELRSVTKASEDLHLSQPAVSIQLKNLQKQFDIPLMEIIGRKVYITEFGKNIAEAAHRILEEVDAIDNKTLAFKGKLVGQLKLSVVSTGKYVMPYYLSDFLNAHPGVNLNMDVTNKLKVIETLEENTVDFALVSTLPKHIEVHREPLISNTLFWVCNHQSNFSDKDNTAVLKKRPLIFRENGSATRQAMETFLKKRNITAYKRLELTSNEAVKQAVIAGIGNSLMPIIGLKNALKNNIIKIIPFRETPINTEWNLIWLKNKRLSPLAEAYLAYIRNEKEKIKREKFSWYSDFTTSYQNLLTSE